MSLTGAIQRLQSLALQSSPDLRAAPDYPVDDASVLPLCIAYLKSGTGQPDDSTNTRLLYTIGVDFHVSRISLKNAYSQLATFCVNFHLRLAGDPTLNSNVETVDFPAGFTVVPTQWNRIQTIAASFDIPVKMFSAPLSST